jgi:hypothetical protein
MAQKNALLKIAPDTAGNPCYEVIKKEDLQAAFRDAMIDALNQITGQINSLVDTVTATAPQGLWTWNFTSRWDYDMWW